MQRNTGYFPTESLEPSSNRLFSRSALNEGYLFRGSLKHEIADAPTIDPVHAAGACYCRECKHWQEPYDYCKEFAAERNQGDFCSYGKRRED